jgi:hypothetical protein
MTRTEFVEIINRAEEVLKDAGIPFTPYQQIEEQEWEGLIKEAKAIGLTPGDVRNFLWGQK